MKMMIRIIFVAVFCFSLTAHADDDLLGGLRDRYDNVKIERVIKSDTVQLNNGKKIRLIGIKALDKIRRFKDVERDQNGFVIEETTTDPTIDIEDRVSDFAYELMFNKKVTVELDTQALDESGYTWGYIFLPDGTMANAEILRQGFAQLQIQPPNTKYAERLREAYREARQEQRGIHAE